METSPTSSKASKSGIEHSGELIGDIGSGHFGEALDDGVSVVRDVGGILESLGGLGVHYGKVATKYVDKLVPLAESKILSAAQLLIDGAKYTTGEVILTQGTVSKMRRTAYRGLSSSDRCEQA